MITKLLTLMKIVMEDNDNLSNFLQGYIKIYILFPGGSRKIKIEEKKLVMVPLLIFGNVQFWKY